MNNTDRIRLLLEQIHDTEQRLAGLRAKLCWTAECQFEWTDWLCIPLSREEPPSVVTNSGSSTLQRMGPDGFEPSTSRLSGVAVEIRFTTICRIYSDLSRNLPDLKIADTTGNRVESTVEPTAATH